MMIGSLSISSVTMALDGNKTKEVNKEMSRYKDIVELWKGFGIESSADLESHLENFSILFAYNSGAIENREITYHDTREIFESGKVSGYSGNLKTLFEISNMKDAYRLMLKWFDEKTPLSLESIKEMHYQIAKLTYDQRRWELGERPGQFKKDDRWGVGRHDIAAPVEEVEANLQEDLDEINSYAGSKPLVAAAFFHARFEGVHAFADGNGRCGRALMNYYLITHDHPPVVVYEEDKSQYYKALDEYDETGDLSPLIGFLEAQAEKTWLPTLERYEHSKGEPDLVVSAKNRKHSLSDYLDQADGIGIDALMEQLAEPSDVRTNAPELGKDNPAR